MTTWNEVVGYLKDNYQVKEVDDFLEVVMDFEDDRKQVIWLKQIKFDEDDIWIQIASPVGNIMPEDMDAALELLGRDHMGGLVKFGEMYFVLHGIPLDDLSEKELLNPIMHVAMAADTLEKEFIGGDEL